MQKRVSVIDRNIFYIKHCLRDVKIKAVCFCGIKVISNSNHAVQKT